VQFAQAFLDTYPIEHDFRQECIAEHHPDLKEGGRFRLQNETIRSQKEETKTD